MSPCFFSFTCPTPWTYASSSSDSEQAAAHLVVATTLGEQHTAPPEDGSVVYVNTLSEIRVDYDASVRTHDKGPAAPEDGRLTLTAGEQADLVATATIPRVAAVDVETVSSWRMRRLSFESESLASIVAECNRHNRTQLVLEGEAVANQRFTSVFAAGDPGSFVAFLQLTSAVEASETGSEIRLRQAP